jgi:hypothetical protein
MKLASEKTANFLKLKYELRGFFITTDTNVAQLVKVATEQMLRSPRKTNQRNPEPLLKEIINNRRLFSFEKETWRCIQWNYTPPTVRG